MFCEIEINMSPVEDETARLGGFKNHWRSWLKTIPIWLIHHFSSWAERLNPPTNDKDKLQDLGWGYVRWLATLAVHVRDLGSMVRNWTDIGSVDWKVVEVQCAPCLCKYMFIGKMEYGNFRGDAGCSGHHFFVHQIHGGRCAHVPVQSFHPRVSRAESWGQYWWLLYMEANRFDQVIPAINGVSIAVQEDFLGGALRFSRRILPEGSCFRKVQVGETWYVFFFWGGRG